MEVNITIPQNDPKGAQKALVSALWTIKQGRKAVLRAHTNQLWRIHSSDIEDLKKRKDFKLEEPIKGTNWPEGLYLTGGYMLAPKTQPNAVEKVKGNFIAEGAFRMSEAAAGAVKDLDNSATEAQIRKALKAAEVKEKVQVANVAQLIDGKKQGKFVLEKTKYQPYEW